AGSIRASTGTTNRARPIPTAACNALPSAIIATAVSAPNQPIVIPIATNPGAPWGLKADRAIVETRSDRRRRRWLDRLSHPRAKETSQLPLDLTHAATISLTNSDALLFPGDHLQFTAQPAVYAGALPEAAEQKAS